MAWPAASKPLFPLAASPAWVLAARFTDRVGKGLRGAPRDALIADVTPPGSRGAAFGVRQTLDTLGAVLGPVAAILLMAALNGDMRQVFAFAVIPAVAAVVLLVLAVEEPAPAAGRAAGQAPVRWSEVGALPAAFWTTVAVGVVFTLARFSEAFLVLRGASAGLPMVLTPAVLVAMNLAYAAVSAPAGDLSDRAGRRPLLAWGLAVLIVADLALAWAPGVAGVLLGAALWGVHMGLTQGLLSALVADAAPARLRGTAFGLFNLATGVALLFASGLAGGLWSLAGPALTFLVGAGFGAAALAGLLALVRSPRALQRS